MVKLNIRLTVTISLRVHLLWFLSSAFGIPSRVRTLLLGVLWYVHTHLTWSGLTIQTTKWVVESNYVTNWQLDWCACKVTNTYRSISILGNYKKMPDTDLLVFSHRSHSFNYPWAPRVSFESTLQPSSNNSLRPRFDLSVRLQNHPTHNWFNFLITIRNFSRAGYECSRIIANFALVLVEKVCTKQTVMW